MSDLDKEMMLCLEDMPPMLSHAEFLPEMYKAGEQYGFMPHEVEMCADTYYYGEVSGCYIVQ